MTARRNDHLNFQVQLQVVANLHSMSTNEQSDEHVVQSILKVESFCQCQVHILYDKNGFLHLLHSKGNGRGF